MGWSLTLNDILTTLAILFGPVIGVFFTRSLDRRREYQSRRYYLFATLMRTRRQPVSPEHVGALNLVEIEFAKDERVRLAWKEYMKHLGTEHHRRLEETVSVTNSTEETENRNKKFWERIGTEREKLRSRLIYQMAKSLNFDVEQLEILEGGYTPQGWVDDDDEQRRLRRSIMTTLSGERPLPVFQVSNPEIFDWGKRAREFLDGLKQHSTSLPIHLTRGLSHIDQNISDNKKGDVSRT